MFVNTNNNLPSSDSPFISTEKSKKWTEEEDKNLILAYQRGDSPQFIQKKYFPDRTLKAVKYRYFNTWKGFIKEMKFSENIEVTRTSMGKIINHIKDPSGSILVSTCNKYVGITKPWGFLDDKSLFMGIKNYKDGWSLISSNIFNFERGPSACYNRYHKYWKVKLIEININNIEDVVNKNFEVYKVNDNEQAVRLIDDELNPVELSHTNLNQASIFPLNTSSDSSSNSKKWSPEDDKRLILALKNKMSIPSIQKECFPDKLVGRVQRRYDLIWQYAIYDVDQIPDDIEVTRTKIDKTVIHQIKDLSGQIFISACSNKVGSEIDWSLADDENLLAGIVAFKENWGLISSRNFNFKKRGEGL